MDRAVMARVDSSAGYSACDHPKTFQWGDETLMVDRIIREWREPGVKIYLVSTPDGRRFRLTLEEISGKWSALEVFLKK